MKTNLSLRNATARLNEPIDPEEIALTREAWTAGQLAWKLRPYQYDIYETIWDLIDRLRNAEPSETEFRVGAVVASRKIGKSFLESLISFEFGFRYPGSIIHIAAPTAVNAREIFLTEFRQLLTDCPVDLRPRPKGIDQHWYFPNGSSIVIKGVDKNPDGLRGPSSHLNFVDEAAYVTRLQYVVDSILYPMTVNTRGPTILCSTLNQSPNAEFNEYAKRCRALGQAETVSIYQAGFTPQQIAAEKNAVNESTWKIEYECEEGRDANMTVVPEWLPAVAEGLTEAAPEYPQFDTSYIPPGAYWQRFTAVDFGTSDNTVMLTGYYDFSASILWITQEGLLQGAAVTAGNIARVIKNLETADNEERPRSISAPEIARFGDHDIPMLQSLQTDQHLAIQSISKAAGLEGMVNLFRSYVSQGKLRVHPRCVNLIGCLEHAAWTTRASTRKGAPRERVLTRSVLVDANKQVLGHFDALMTAVYMVVAVDKRKSINPLPNTFVTQGQAKTWGAYSPEGYGRATLTAAKTQRPGFVPPGARKR